MQTMTLETVRIEDLVAHPLNESMYGATTLDDAFVDSIRQTGLLQPPVIAPLVNWATGEVDETRYRIIAGHRRIAALSELGIDTVECYYREYELEVEERFDFLASNKHRSKNFLMMLNETLQVLDIYQESCQPSGDAASEGVLDDEQHSTFKRFDGLTMDEAAVKLGASRDFVMAVRVVFADDYRTKYFESLERAGTKLTKTGIADFVKQWDKVRKDVRAEKINLYEAAKELREAKRNVIGKRKTSATVKAEKAAKSKSVDAGDSLAINNLDNAINFIEEYFEPDLFMDGEIMLTKAPLGNLLVAWAERIITFQN